MTEDEHSFIDYYKILEVSPDCSSKALEGAYRSLAKKYHPDHSATANVEKLTEVITAYKKLKNKENRLNYDSLYSRMTGHLFIRSSDPSEDQTAISDSEAHEKMLLLLYKKRREQARDAGVGHFYLQEMLGCTDDIFEFHVWYLKEKGFIITTDQGTLAITIEGIDHVISMSKEVLREKLMLIQMSE